MNILLPNTGWQVRALGDCLRIDAPLRIPDPDAEADLLCIGPDSIEQRTGRIISRPTVGQVRPRSGKYAFDKGDLLYSKIRPNLSKATIAPSNGYCSADMYPLKPSPGISVAYILYVILSPWFTRIVTSLSIRAQMPKVNRETLFGIGVPVPALEEQHRIVDILNHAASIRRLREEARAKAREVIPALFVEMFGDPATNPKGWEIRKLSELGSLDRGKSKHRPRNAPVLFGGPYPFIQTGDVANSGGVITSYTETYSEDGLRQSKLWPAGTLCITIAANIAKTGVLSFDACFPDSVVGFTPAGAATTSYVQYFLHFLQPYLEKSAPQLAQKNINLEILRDINIPAPPLALQQEFAERVAEVEGISSLNDKAVEVADQMAASLMAQVFGSAA